MRSPLSPCPRRSRAELWSCPTAGTYLDGAPKGHRVSVAGGTDGEVCLAGLAQMVRSAWQVCLAGLQIMPVPSFTSFIESPP